MLILFLSYRGSEFISVATTYRWFCLLICDHSNIVVVLHLFFFGGGFTPLFECDTDSGTLISTIFDLKGDVAQWLVQIPIGTKYLKKIVS